MLSRPFIHTYILHEHLFPHTQNTWSTFESLNQYFERERERGKKGKKRKKEEEEIKARIMRFV